MNYVNHLNGFFNKANADIRMKPNHISLYMMLFNNWNSNRFKNPTSFPKEKIMKASKISSNTTYYKCIKELQLYGFIEHLPTSNPYLNSNVIMVDLSEYGKFGLKINEINYPIFEQDNQIALSKNSQHNEQVNELAYILNNNKTKLNNINIEIGTQSNFDSNENLIFKKNIDSNDSLKKEKKSSAKKEEKYKSNSEIPSLESVVDYFIFKLSTETEGNRFFNYYSSIDWLIGGKTKMRDWKAVARNWMMNQYKFQPKSNRHPELGEGLKPNHLHTANSKNYDEPL